MIKRITNRKQREELKIKRLLPKLIKLLIKKGIITKEELEDLN